MHLHWLDKQGRPNDYWPDFKGNAVLNLEATKKLFEESGHPAEGVFAAIKAGKPAAIDLVRGGCWGGSGAAGLGLFRALSDRSEGVDGGEFEPG